MKALEIALTMSFTGVESDSDAFDSDYIFRADVVDADACQGGGMGLDRYIYKVDEDPEVRDGAISASCAPGDYTVEVGTYVSRQRQAGLGHRRLHGGRPRPTATGVIRQLPPSPR